MDETILTTEHGAILYDPRILNHIGPTVFDAEAWPRQVTVVGTTGGAGRGTTRFVASEAGEFALRHYYRGGLVARLFEDHYLWLGADATRPFREWRLLAQLWEAGLPVPRPAAARYLRRSLTYTGDILTCRLAGVRALSNLLASRALTAEQWRRIGATLRRFHDAGVWHADLNAHNIQLDADGAVYLLDFDRGRLRSPGPWQYRNLARLKRSLEKIRRLAPETRYSESDWRSLRDAYADGGDG